MHPQDTTVPDGEVWRPVVGLEGWYSVSSLGRVRRDKPGKATYVGRIQQPYVNKEGYYFVCMSRHGHNERQSVHRLVALAFLGESPDGHEVDHCDGDPSHNHVANLEYVTHLENLRRAVLRRIAATGAPSPNTALTVADIQAIRASTEAQDTLAERYGLQQGSISQIRLGKRWKHIPIVVPVPGV